jgi:ribosome-binding factor A
LRFIYDTGQDSAHRVEEILRELHEEEGGKSRT